MSEGLGGCRYPCHGWWPHREPRGHMKINLPVFKDEDTKDAITYQSWHWDLKVYHCTWCQVCTLLLYVICSLQVYPGELVRSLGTDITLEPGTLSALHGWQWDSIGLGVCLLRHLQILAASFPEHFPLDHLTELKHDHFYGGLPKWLKAMVDYLKASTNEKTYLDYLWAAREAEKEVAMEPSCSKMADI